MRVSCPDGVREARPRRRVSQPDAPTPRQPDNHSHFPHRLRGEKPLPSASSATRIRGSAFSPSVVATVSLHSGWPRWAHGWSRSTSPRRSAPANGRSRMERPRHGRGGCDRTRCPDGARRWASHVAAASPPVLAHAQPFTTRRGDRCAVRRMPRKLPSPAVPAVPPSAPHPAHRTHPPTAAPSPPRFRPSNSRLTIQRVLA